MMPPAALVGPGSGVAVPDAVNGHIAESWFGAADLDILAFAFVPLQSDTGKTADGIRHIILEAVAEDLRAGGGFHLEEAFIDGSFAPAKKGVWA
jgi:hypothetical protein